MKPRNPNAGTVFAGRQTLPGSSTVVFRRDMHLAREIIRRGRGIRPGHPEVRGR